MSTESSARIDELLQKIEERIQNSEDVGPTERTKLATFLSALRKEREAEGKDRLELIEQIKAYEEAYEKLTQPANRTGTVLEVLDEVTALVMLGDSQYVCSVDPKSELSLAKGEQVKLNEAYAIIGVLERIPIGAVVKVDERLPDGRIKVGSDVQGNGGRFVLVAASIADSVVEAGDEVRLDESGRFAIEHFPGKARSTFVADEVSDISWDQIGGQEEAKRVIRETIELPMLYPETFAKYEKTPVKGILLYGPPGCGKTLIGKALARSLAQSYSEHSETPVEEYFLHLSGPKILNMWLGETERMVRELFATARKKASEGKIVVIFMDEAEAVLRTRSSGRWMNISNTVVPQFCAELDGLVETKNIVLVLTSNRPDYIDPAVLRPERIDRKVKIGRPNKTATAQILGIYLKPALPFDKALMEQAEGEPECARKLLIDEATEYVWRIHKETEFLRMYFRSGETKVLHWRDFLSGALLKAAVDRAKDKAIMRSLQSQEAEHGISVSDLLESIKEEYGENEIFPQSDNIDDWLRLLDQDPESVVNIEPISNMVKQGWATDVV